MVMFYHLGDAIIEYRVLFFVIGSLETLLFHMNTKLQIASLLVSYFEVFLLLLLGLEP